MNRRNLGDEGGSVAEGNTSVAEREGVGGGDGAGLGAGGVSVPMGTRTDSPRKDVGAMLGGTGVNPLSGGFTGEGRGLGVSVAVITGIGATVGGVSTLRGVGASKRRGAGAQRGAVSAFTSRFKSTSEEAQIANAPNASNVASILSHGRSSE